MSIPEHDQARASRHSHNGGSLTATERSCDKVADDLAKLALHRHDPVDRLAHLNRITDLVEWSIWDAVYAARDQGHSWSRIGDALGISKQAAHERYRRVHK